MVHTKVSDFMTEKDIQNEQHAFSIVYKDTVHNFEVALLMLCAA